MEMGLSFLQVREIKNWPEFLAKLEKAGHNTQPCPGKRIWELLPHDIQADIQRLSRNQSPSEAEQTSIVDHLNSAVLCCQDFYQEQHFADIEIPEAIQQMVNNRANATPADLQRLNRHLIELAYPQEISRNLENIIHSIENHFAPIDRSVERREEIICQLGSYPDIDANGFKVHSGKRAFAWKNRVKKGNAIGGTVFFIPPGSYADQVDEVEVQVSEQNIRSVLSIPIYQYLRSTHIPEEFKQWDYPKLLSKWEVQIRSHIPGITSIMVSSETEKIFDAARNAIQKIIDHRNTNGLKDRSDLKDMIEALDHIQERTLLEMCPQQPDKKRNFDAEKKLYEERKKEALRRLQIRLYDIQHDFTNLTHDNIVEHIIKILKHLKILEVEGAAPEDALSKFLKSRAFEIRSAMRDEMQRVREGGSLNLELPGETYMVPLDCICAKSHTQSLEKIRIKLKGNQISIDCHS